MERKMNRESGNDVEGMEDAGGGTKSRVREQRNQGRRRREKMLREGRKAGEGKRGTRESIERKGSY